MLNTKGAMLVSSRDMEGLPTILLICDTRSSRTADKYCEMHGFQTTIAHNPSMGVTQIKGVFPTIPRGGINPYGGGADVDGLVASLEAVFGDDRFVFIDND